MGRPGLGGLGGDSTQAIGASFWLSKVRTADREGPAPASAWLEKKKNAPARALPGGKERPSLDGHSVGLAVDFLSWNLPSAAWWHRLERSFPHRRDRKCPGLGGPGGIPAQASMGIRLVRSHPCGLHGSLNHTIRGLMTMQAKGNCCASCVGRDSDAANWYVNRLPLGA